MVIRTLRNHRLVLAWLLVPVVSVALIVALPVTASSAPTAAVARAPVPAGFWSSATTPGITASTDAAAVELGLKFKSSVAGSVTGIRFFKGTGNSGIHKGSLWSATGTRLATGTFTNETATGWQILTFSAPVSVAANTIYVASYYAPAGHYAYTQNQFVSALVKAPLTAPAGSNGVYRYGSGGGFPTSSYLSTNYWIDPLFVAISLPTTTSSSATPPATSPTTAPTITTTTTTTAPAASCATKQVWQNLDACGWPGPVTTGYPSGQTFSRTVNGPLTVTTDGAIVDGYRVTGGIRVRARNVVIRNSWVSLDAGGVDGSGVVTIEEGSNATIDQNLLDGTNATHTCVWHAGTSMVVTNNDCIGVNDGIFSWATREGADGSGDNFRIEGNWMHSFTTQASNGHVDGFQTEGSKHGIIRHNTIDVSQGQNAAIAIWNGRKSTDDIVVDDNLLAGGGFAAYAEDYSPSEASPAGGYSVTNVSFTNNRFSTVHFGCVGYWGVWYPRGAPSDRWKRSGNVVLETGQKVDGGNPTNNGVPCN